MIEFKEGVRIRNIKPEIVLAMKVVDGIITRVNYITGNMVYGYLPRLLFVITSVNDSLHMDGSKHYSGEAFDIRTKNWGDEFKMTIFNRVKNSLHPLGFDVIFEGKGTPNEHIHIEYDPKD